MQEAAASLPPETDPRCRPLAGLQALLQGRSIALVGNAASLFEGHHRIDDHDVVIRMNRGPFVLGDEGRAGTRTDILLVSRFRGEEYLSAAPHVVWMTPKYRKKLKPAEVQRLYFYPPAWWQEVVDQVGSRPSTGCMGIDLVSRLAGPGRIHLYGFDFWKSPTTYTGEIRPGPHSPDSEETFARTRIRPEQIAG